MSGCVCGADEPCVGRCDKHDRDLHGYPCGDCQREWRQANPKRAAEIERMASRARRTTTHPTDPGDSHE